MQSFLEFSDADPHEDPEVVLKEVFNREISFHTTYEGYEEYKELKVAQRVTEKFSKKILNILIDNFPRLVLETMENNYGEEVAIDFIEFYFRKNVFVRMGINCYSSSELGLGTCLCCSHDPYLKTYITPGEVLKELKKKPSFNSWVFYFIKKY